MRRGVLAIVLLATACQRSPTAPTAIPIPEYDRTDWQHWIDADGDCQDTRQEVLIEESLIATTLDPRGCRVIAGRWRDGYTGAVYTDPGELKSITVFHSQMPIAAEAGLGVNRDSWCQHAMAWRAVKQRWNLSITAEEDRATREMCS